MKKSFLLLSAALVLAGFLSAPPTFAESISSFHSDIHINPNSSINVTETIVYNFGGLSRHGIYRDIPETFNNNTQIISVTDEQGNPLNYQVSHSFRNTQIKIGDADKTITGMHAYVINYQVERELSFFETQDELYWNVTGTDWGLYIFDASADITLPFALSENQTSIDCYTGFYGEDKKIALRA